MDVVVTENCSADNRGVGAVGSKMVLPIEKTGTACPGVDSCGVRHEGSYRAGISA